MQASARPTALLPAPTVALSQMIVTPVVYLDRVVMYPAKPGAVHISTLTERF